MSASKSKILNDHVIVSAKIRFSKKDIETAKTWERENDYNYRGDLAHLLLDCLTEGAISGVAEVDDEIEVE